MEFERLAFSISEVAGRLGVCDQTVRRRLRDGTIRSIHLGSKQLVTAAELRRLLRERHAITHDTGDIE
jgi:excisionase family DNA binding protein